MKEGKLIDITNLLEYKRLFELAECPYLAVEGAEYSADYHFRATDIDDGSLSKRKPIPIFTGLGEIRKKRVMRLIQKGKNERL